MVVKICGRHHWLWRAVDDEGEVLDFLIQPRRCARSAQRLLRKLLKKQGFKSPGSAQRFLSIHAAVYNAFYVQRHLLPRRIFKEFRAGTFAVWQQNCLPA